MGDYKNTLSPKGMKKETDTMCGLVTAGVRCGGGLMKVLDISKMEEFLGHRKYRCDKCGATYKFTD